MDASNSINAITLLGSTMRALPTELVRKILKRLLQEYLNKDMPLVLTSTDYVTNIVVGLLGSVQSLEPLVDTWLFLQRTKKECFLTADEELAIKVVNIAVEAAFKVATFFSPRSDRLDDDLPTPIQQHAARIRHIHLHVRIDGARPTSIRAHPLHNLSQNIGYLEVWFPRLRSLTIFLDLPPDLNVRLELRTELAGFRDGPLTAGLHALVESMRQLKCKELYLGWKKRTREGANAPQTMGSSSRGPVVTPLAFFVINFSPAEGEQRVRR